jgi:hypothetical protein
MAEMKKLKAVPLNDTTVAGIGRFVDLSSKKAGFTPDHMKIEMPDPYFSICRISNPPSPWTIDTMERHIKENGQDVPEILMSDRPFVIVAGAPADWAKWTALKALVVPPWHLLELFPQAPHAGLFAVGGSAADPTNVLITLPRETWKNNCHLAKATEAEKIQVVM